MSKATWRHLSAFSSGLRDLPFGVKVHMVLHWRSRG